MKRRPTALGRAAAFDPVSGRYPNQRPLNDPWLTAMMGTGAEFWRKRGVDVPAGVPLYAADDLKVQDSEPYSPGARGFDKREPGGGRVVLLGSSTKALLGQARSRRLPVRMRRQAFQSLAQLVTHELGHVGGLGHTPGVMDEKVALGGGTPWDMRLLSHKLIPRGRRRGRRA